MLPNEMLYEWVKNRFDALHSLDAKKPMTWVIRLITHYLFVKQEPRSNIWMDKLKELGKLINDLEISPDFLVQKSRNTFFAMDEPEGRNTYLIIISWLYDMEAAKRSNFLNNDKKYHYIFKSIYRIFMLIWESIDENVVAIADDFYKKLVLENK